MANLEGMQNKFIVIKRTDVSEFLHPVLEQRLGGALKAIDEVRTVRGLKPASAKTYLVINTDEPYADEVIEILKRHGHWG